MSKDKFSWKSLFVNESPETFPKASDPAPAPGPEETERFPKDASIHVNAPVSSTTSNPFIAEVLEVYEKGFDSLNQENFDFYELFKSVMAVGVNNPQSYQMAFTMGKTIRKDLTKEFLLEKSQYYKDEIEKVFNQYNTVGNTRKNDLDMAITRDKVNLTKAVSDLESQIAGLQRELDEKRRALSLIDAENLEQYNEIRLKLDANTYAKNKIVDSINQVVSGINQYL
jgi:hypothetical protein